MPYGTLDTYGQMHGPKISAAGILGALPTPCVSPKENAISHFYPVVGPSGWLLDHHGGGFQLQGLMWQLQNPWAEQSRGGRCAQVTVPRSESHVGTLPARCNVRMDFGKG